MFVSLSVFVCLFKLRMGMHIRESFSLIYDVTRFPIQLKLGRVYSESP